MYIYGDPEAVAEFAYKATRVRHKNQAGSAVFAGVIYIYQKS